MRYQPPLLPSVEIWTPVTECDGETVDRYDYYVSNPNRFANDEEAFAAFAAAEIFNGELPGKEK